MEFIRPFAKIGREDAGSAGGKGASLGEMTQAGIPVPPGFVVLASTFERFIEETDLIVEIDAILDTVKHEEMHTVEHASEKIQALIHEATMPEDIGVDILKHFKELGAEYVAVRSSATAEDSASAAWAGQLDTYLNTTEKEVLTNVQRCWASLFTPRAIFYRFEKGLNTQKISVAVVVQKMVNSDASGIAFSVHPVTEDRNQLIIEAGWGLGEAIVSGQVTPDAYVVTKEPREILDKNVATKERGMYRIEGGGSDWQPIPAAKQEQQTLSDEQIFALSETILGIEKHYGFPCDIEWAMEADVIYITQSRPITTLAPSFSEAPSEMPSGGASEKWESLAKDYNSFYFRNYIWTRGINRPYDIVSELAGLEAPLAIESKNGDIDYLFKPNAWAAMHNAFVAVLKKDIGRLRKIIEKTNDLGERAVARGREIFDISLSEASDAELVAHLRELSALQEDLYAHGVLLPLLDLQDQSYIAKEMREYLEREAPGKVEEHLLTLTAPEEETFIFRQEKALLALAARASEDAELVAMLRENVGEGALALLRSDFSEFAEALEAHSLEHRWVFYSYSGPAYGPLEFLGLLRDALFHADSPQDRLQRIKSEHAALIERKEAVLKELAPDAFYEELFRVASTFVWAKPTRKEYQSHLYFYMIEGVVAELARRMGISTRDALSLPTEQLQTLTPDLALIKSVYSHHVLMPEAAGAKLYHGSALSEVTGTIHQEAVSDYSGTTEVRGTMACKGKVTGVVRIVNKPEDMSKMNEGDILVSVATTPSIVPAMQKAAAFVTNEGGLTCHAAIVAREMKKPCIIGTKIATEVFKDGDLIEVDANAGVVRKIG